jgi:hypothetical protein
MNRWFTGLLALGTVALSCAPAHAQPRRASGEGGEPAEYGWLSSLEEGKARARQTGKPLLVVVRCVP